MMSKSLLNKITRLYSRNVQLRSSLDQSTVENNKKQQLITKQAEHIKVIREVLEDIANEAKSYQERTGKSVTWLERTTKTLEVTG